jgi:uncharacterized protein YhaN
MKFENIHIESFGPHVNRTLNESDLSSGLTVIHGPNEAGKSAIRALIRMVLFGRMNARSQGASAFNYTHTSNAAGAGSLTMLAQDGKRFNVQRTERKQPVVSGDEDGSQELLTAILGRIDETLYQNVFSISLSELESMDTLGADQIRDRIYSAGLGLGEVSLPDAMKQLDAERSSPSGLWSPSAGLLRKNLTAIAEERRALRDAIAMASGYEDLARNIRDVKEKISVLDADLIKSRTRSARLKSINELRPVVARKKLLEDQIAGFRTVNGFPPDGMDQLNRLTSDMAGVKLQLSDAEVRLRSRTEELELIAPHSGVDEHEAEIKGILSKQKSYEDAVDNLPSVASQLEGERSSLTTGLMSLGEGWSTDTLNAFVDFEGTEARIIATQSEYERHLTAHNDARNQLETLKVTGDKISRDIEDAERQKSALGDVPDLSERDLAARTSKLESLRLTIIDNRSTSAASSPVTETSSNRIVAAGSAVLGIALIVVSAALAQWIGILGGIGLGGIAAYLFTRKASAPTTGVSSDPNSEIQRLLNELNLTGDISERQVVEELSTNQIDISRRTDYEKFEQLQANLAVELQRAQEQIKTATDAFSSAKEDLDAVESSWHALMTDLGFDAGFDAARALASVERIRALKLLKSNAIDLEGRVGAMSARVEEVESALNPITTALGITPALSGHAGATIIHLADVHESYVKNSATTDEMQSEIRRLSENVETLGTQVATLEKDERDLLKLADSATPEEFKTVAVELQERASAEKSLEDLILNQPSVNDSGPDSILTEISETADEEIAAELAAAEDQIRQLDSERGERQVTLGGLRTQKDELEKSNPTSAHELKIDELEQTIEEQAHRWAVLSVAHHAITTTRERYQRERQAPLMQHATEYFTQLTRGSYTRIETVLGEDEIRVFDEHDVAKGVDELSRGTAEQLYLAIRFALITEYCEHSEPLPLVMDDITVNFDKDRAKSAFEAITRLSSTQQILSLTCHESTVDGFIKAATETGLPAPAIVRL